MRKVVVLALIAAACAGSPPSEIQSRAGADAGPAAAFDRLTEDYIAAYMEAWPQRATRLGVHRYDDALPDVSESGRKAWASTNRQLLSRLETIPRDGLQDTRYYDHRILEYQLRGNLLEVEEVQGWRKDPRMYNGIAASSISSLADRPFAPLSERLESMIARFGGFAAHFAAARANLRDVPPLWVELAVRGTRGTTKFLKVNLMQALSAQGYATLDAEMRTRFERARDAAIGEVEKFIAWLEQDLSPRADGDFRLGPVLFEKKLRYDEHFELSCEQLRAMNEEAITYYQDWVGKVSEKVDPEADPASVMKSITEDFPPPGALISTAETLVKDAQRFVIENAIVPLPNDSLPIVRPTPEYRRMSFASMESPGPFEENVSEAFYNITNVDPEWDAERQAQHLTYFNYPGLLGISVHEAVPGHYTHGLYKAQSPSRLRQIFVPNSLTEGWAHYAEQMMLDEGFGERDPKVRLGQLRRALQRHARWYAGVEMHCFGETVENAAARFQEIAYFAEFPALRETQRGTYDPTYLYYALGRMEILRIRDALQQKRGDAFVLGEFHRDLLTQGLPLPLFERHALGR